MSVNWRRVLSRARDSARMHTNIVPLYILTQWGVRLKERDKPISFADLVKEFGISVEAIVRMGGGFYEHWGAIISPNGREATAGWQQTCILVVPKDQIGVIALVVDRSGPEPLFLVEFREEAFATPFPGQVVASASAVCSYSNRTGAHGYKGAAEYLAILDNLRQIASTGCNGDMGREMKSNRIVILEWRPKSGKQKPDLSKKHYVWMTKEELRKLVKGGNASIHLLEALGFYALL